MRQSDVQPPAGGVNRIDADSIPGRLAFGGFHSIDPCHPVAVAAVDDSVERCGECRRPAHWLEPEFAFGPIDHRLRILSVVVSVTEPIELDSLLHTGKQSSDSGLRVRLSRRKRAQKNASEHSRQCRPCARAPAQGRGPAHAARAVQSGNAPSADRPGDRGAAPRLRDRVRADRFTAALRRVRT